MLLFQENAGSIYCGDALTELKLLPAESVQICLTSPPYWGLRNFGSASEQIWPVLPAPVPQAQVSNAEGGGQPDCNHRWSASLKINRRHPGDKSTLTGRNHAELSKAIKHFGVVCLDCGAWKGQLGLEPSVDLYVEHLVSILLEVKRILKKDGTLYLNLADSYRNKSLNLVPEKVMFALVANGFLLINKIIWYKPNAGNISEVTRQIGNAVPVNMAKALVKSIFEANK